MGPWFASADSPKNPPANPDGSYTVKVRGFCEGTGQAAVTGGALTLSASVTDEDGHSGTLAVTGLAVDATNHFTGSGTVFGKSMTISGRLDPIDSAETLLKTARITATFATTDSHRGRVAGFVPITPGDPTPPGGGGSPPGGPAPGGPPPAVPGPGNPPPAKDGKPPGSRSKRGQAPPGRTPGRD